MAVERSRAFNVCLISIRIVDRSRLTQFKRCALQIWCFGNGVGILLCANLSRKKCPYQLVEPVRRWRYRETRTTAAFCCQSEVYGQRTLILMTPNNSGEWTTHVSLYIITHYIYAVFEARIFAHPYLLIFSATWIGMFETAVELNWVPSKQHRSRGLQIRLNPRWGQRMKFDDKVKSAIIPRFSERDCGGSYRPLRRRPVLSLFWTVVLRFGNEERNRHNIVRWHFLPHRTDTPLQFCTAAPLYSASKNHQ